LTESIGGIFILQTYSESQNLLQNICLQLGWTDLSWLWKYPGFCKWMEDSRRSS